MFLKRSLPHLLILSLAIILTNCTLPDEFNPDNYNTTIQWEPGLQAPMAYGDLSIEDLLMEFDDESFLSEDSTGFLYFVYDTSQTVNAEDYLPAIEDQHFVQIFFSAPYDLPPDSLGVIWDTTLYQQDRSFKFEKTGDEQLDSIELKSGEAVMDVTSTIRHAGILEIHSSAIKLDGQPFMERIVISDSTGTFTDQTIIDLAGYIISLDNSDPDSSLLDLTFDFYLINSGNSILASEVVDIRVTFQDLEFQTAYGYAGTYDSLIVDRETIDIDLPDFDFEGTVKLYDPQLHLDIWNSFGLSFGVELLDIEGRFKDGSSLAINIDAADNPIIVNEPILAQAGQSIQTEVSIDRTNSNFHEIGTTDLRGLQYSVRAFANPAGATTDNFLQDTSKMTVNLEALIPLHIRIEDVVLTDTFEFEMTDSIDNPIGDKPIGPENIESMYIILDTENGLPIDIELQVYFVDSNWVKVDSLFDNTNRHILPSGILDTDDRVIFRTQNTTQIILTQQQIQNIWDADNLIIEAVIKTKDDTGVIRDVKFYSEYSLYFKLGAGAEISLTNE